jgi:uncharacterized protein YecE (DUF72 family)
VQSATDDGGLGAHPSSVIYVGTAGWSIPRASAERFPGEGTHLERYSRVLRCVEINSSFYRPHKPETYAKWAEGTGRKFRFAVKVPKLITHELRLRRSRAPFERFLEETSALGSRRGPLLVQLPPSFQFDARAATAFFRMARERYDGPMVCEPRHASWFTDVADGLLKRHRVGRVAADPPTSKESDVPGGWNGIAYYRLHGSPRMYWSRYEAPFIARVANEIKTLAESADVWCLFDNTATGSAIENALELQQLLK